MNSPCVFLLLKSYDYTVVRQDSQQEQDVNSAWQPEFPFLKKTLRVCVCVCT